MAYCSSDFLPLLQQHDLADYQRLWDLQLDTVDTPNRERGGWSSVCRLELGGKAFYIKRQSNHLSRSFSRPLGEPTFAREFRNIEAYQKSGVGALEAVYYQERKIHGELQAILITRALDDYQPFSTVVQGWAEMSQELRNTYLRVVAQLVGCLHQSRLTHHCLYPKHVYINLELDVPARFIDLEKTRYQLLRKRESIADLSAFLRRCPHVSDEERVLFLGEYLAINDLGLSAESLLRDFYERKLDKESRK